MLNVNRFVSLQQYEAKWGCDFKGNDFWNTNLPDPNYCGISCVSNKECTHFTYTPDGKCWLKTGPVNRNQAIVSQNQKTICGIVLISRNVNLKESNTFMVSAMSFLV